jgi:GAF domain-containing protein
VPPVPAAPGHGDATAPHPRGDSRLPEAFVAFTQHAEATAQAGLERATISALVAAMTDRGSEVYGVADTAQVLADDVVERADADAAAILVPDEGRWRVAGGVGLRPVERRHILNDKHWLIQETALGGRALLIGDTDVVRPQLTHAPLAAWQHLLAVPIPGVRVVVLLARGNESPEFTEEDLAAIAPVAAEAADLIRNALAARRLARMLGPLREEDTPVLRRSH